MMKMSGCCCCCCCWVISEFDISHKMTKGMKCPFGLLVYQPRVLPCLGLWDSAMQNKVNSFRNAHCFWWKAIFSWCEKNIHRSSSLPDAPFWYSWAWGLCETNSNLKQASLTWLRMLQEEFGSPSFGAMGRWAGYLFRSHNTDHLDVTLNDVWDEFGPSVHWIWSILSGFHRHHGDRK